jgi:hypothetical protein
MTSPINKLITRDFANNFIGFIDQNCIASDINSQTSAGLRIEPVGYGNGFHGMVYS